MKKILLLAILSLSSVAGASQLACDPQPTGVYNATHEIGYYDSNYRCSNSQWNFVVNAAQRKALEECYQEYSNCEVRVSGVIDTVWDGVYGCKARATVHGH